MAAVINMENSANTDAEKKCCGGFIDLTTGTIVIAYIEHVITIIAAIVWLITANTDLGLIGNLKDLVGISDEGIWKLFVHLVLPGFFLTCGCVGCVHLGVVKKWPFFLLPITVLQIIWASHGFDMMTSSIGTLAGGATPFLGGVWFLVGIVRSQMVKSAIEDDGSVEGVMFLSALFSFGTFIWQIWFLSIVGKCFLFLRKENKIAKSTVRYVKSGNTNEACDENEDPA